jgi:hypothetical protein
MKHKNGEVVKNQRDYEDLLERASFALVVGPFFVALAMIGLSFAAMTARFAFDVVSNAGRLP